MLSDSVLELWAATAEREPSPGWSVTALREDTAAPPRPLFAEAELGAVSGPSQLRGPAGRCFGRTQVGGVTRGSGQGLPPGVPPVGARSGRVRLSAGSLASPGRWGG